MTWPWEPRRETLEEMAAYWAGAKMPKGVLAYVYGPPIFRCTGCGISTDSVRYSNDLRRLKKGDHCMTGWAHAHKFVRADPPDVPR